MPASRRTSPSNHIAKLSASVRPTDGGVSAAKYSAVERARASLPVDGKAETPAQVAAAPESKVASLAARHRRAPV